jgi:eukaryotic-like serine/threonine-protein kinase
MSPPFDLQEPSELDAAKTDPDLGAARRAVDRPRTRVGRYTIIQQIGSDPMSSVYLAAMAGPAAQAQVVAIKHVHPHLARDPDFSSVFIDQATLASRIRHRNVLPILEVMIEGPEIFLVLEQVDGAGLAALVRAAHARQRPIPLPIAVALAIDILNGVHAAHEARTQTGAPLHILHRAVSPQNVLVGADGTARLYDVGLAKAWQATRAGRRHRLAQDACYLAPEQIRQEPLTRAADIFAASALAWELITSRPLFTGGGELERMVGVLDRRGLLAPSAVAPHIPQPLDRIILKGLAEDLQRRHPSALAMAEAIERVVRPASRRQVGEWVAETAGPALFRSGPLLEGLTSVEALSAPTTVRGPTRRVWPGLQADRWVGHLRRVHGRLEQVRTRVAAERRPLMGALAGALLIATALVVRCPADPPAVQAELTPVPSAAVIEPLSPVVVPDQPAPEPPAPEPPPAVAEVTPPPAPEPPPAVAEEQAPVAKAEPPAPPASVEQPPRRRARVFSLEQALEAEEVEEPEVSLAENADSVAPLPATSEASAILNEPANPAPEQVKLRRKRAPLVTEDRRVPLLE